MAIYSKQSLETLRSRIDLVEVLNPYIKWQRSGSSYKALCPFHDEKTPSFTVQRGDTHYHCFGCGAHGDAIQFLMTHVKMSFTDAVENLSEKFHVELEVGDKEAPKGPSRASLKDALEKACEFYHFYLLHTMEGHAALDYLYKRGIDLEFIQKFELGLAPKAPHFLKAMWEQKISNETLEAAGLFSKGKEFFYDRITIPIRDAVGAVIGFSARKYKEETFGGKYINTPETPLFKKSKVLFGLSFSRKMIATTRKALIVEGQIDALRLIHAGFPWAVAGQGTAFGEEMAKELIHLGVREVYLSLDGDNAGQEATVKIGHIFQKAGVDVSVIPLPAKWDPDLYIQEKGPEEWAKLLEQKVDYLTFLVSHFSKSLNIETPAGKSQLVQTIVKQIRTWDEPLMVHESLKKLSKITNTPDALLGAPPPIVQTQVKKSSHVTFTEINPDRILEADLLRWLFLMGEIEPKLVQLAKDNLRADHFFTTQGKTLFEKYMLAASENSPRDLISFMIGLEKEDDALFLEEILQKKVNREKGVLLFTETIQKVLERKWMHEREEIKVKIYSGGCSEAEVLALAKEFDLLKKQRPIVKEHNN